MLLKFGRLMRRAAWAPVSVLLFHRIIGWTPWRQPLDFFMHFSGGASMAYVAFYALEFFREELGIVKMPGRVLFSFTFACTVGLFWEFAELCSDVFLHTHIQKSLYETLSDLIADTTGAIAALTAIWFARLFAGGRGGESIPGGPPGAQTTLTPAAADPSSPEGTR